MSSSTTYLTPPPRRRSTRTSQSSNSVVADNTLLVDSSDDVSRWRRTLATFLSEACLALDGSFFYLIRSNGWKSLCQLTGLSPEVYSALLLECKLVSIRQNSDGTRSAFGENEEWKEFLRLHGLRGDTYGRGGGVEFSTARINTIAIERMEGMNINDATTDTAKGKVSRDMAVLRVGHVDGTGKPPAPTAINRNEDQLFGVDGEIRSKLLQKESQPEVVEKINETCHNIGLALKLWDAAFSAIHAHNPTPEHCNKTQEIIDRAMFQMRKMGFSVTPKMHGMEHHVVTQMRNIPGGLGRLMEHWIEQYHQIGYRLDLAYCRVGSLVGQAAIRSRVEKRGMNPRVQMNKKALQARYVGSRKRRADAIERDEKKVLIKELKKHKLHHPLNHKLL